MGLAGGFAATSLAAEDITGSDGLSTFAATMISIGGALAAVPLARHMAAHGRRPGLRAGWSVAALPARCMAVSRRRSPRHLPASHRSACSGSVSGQGTSLARPATRPRTSPSRLRAGPHHRDPRVGLVDRIRARADRGPGPDRLGRRAVGVGGALGSVSDGQCSSSPRRLFVVHRFLRPDPLLLATETRRPSRLRRAGTASWRASFRSAGTAKRWLPSPPWRSARRSWSPS